MTPQQVLLPGDTLTQILASAADCALFSRFYRFENLPDGGSGVISRCSKPPNDGVVGAVRQDGIGHWQGESLTLLGKTCNNNNNMLYTWSAGCSVILWQVADSQVGACAIA
jgi:hypothetical protein